MGVMGEWVKLRYLNVLKRTLEKRLRLHWKKHWIKTVDV